MHPDLNDDQLADRRALMIRILHDMARGITCIPRFVEAIKHRVRSPRPSRAGSNRKAGGQPGGCCNSKTPAEKLEHRLWKADDLLSKLGEEKVNIARFDKLRQQYYSIKNDIKRLCVGNGMEIPDLPIGPNSPFSNYAPRKRKT